MRVDPDPAVQMTAIQVFTTDEAAFIATDTAYFGYDGRITGFGPKHLFAAPLRLAFGCHGLCSPMQLQETLAALLPGEVTQADVLNAMPKALRKIRRSRAREFPGNEPAGRNEIKIFVAMFDDAPHCYVLSTADAPDMGCRAYEWHETEGTHAPAVDIPRIWPHGYWRGPIDSVSLFQAQRRVEFDLLDEGAGVGGDCFLTKVSAEGVTQQKICGWPDKVGQIVRT